MRYSYNFITYYGTKTLFGLMEYNRMEWGGI